MTRQPTNLLQGLIFKALDELYSIAQELDGVTLDQDLEDAMSDLKDNTFQVTEEYLMQQNLACTLHVWPQVAKATVNDVVELMQVFLTPFNFKETAPQFVPLFDSVLYHKDLSIQRKGRLMQTMTQIVTATIKTLHTLKQPNRVNGKPCYDRKEYLDDVKPAYWAKMFNVNITFVEGPIKI